MSEFTENAATANILTLAFHNCQQGLRSTDAVIGWWVESFRRPEISATDVDISDAETRSIEANREFYDRILRRISARAAASEKGTPNG